MVMFAMLFLLIQSLDVVLKPGRNSLKDVIGMVVEIRYTHIHNSSKKQQINLVLKDLGNNILNCTLWENYDVQFHDFSSSRKDFKSPTVVVLQFAKIKEEGICFLLFQRFLIS
ncbi:uncharacterized protein LOC131617851 isoform X4 [Vicia villosa]|uniref:uncharacterized protein LOC131617767 isoform X4 n=1 Tax=Vicia villosa TaxID=3911 RepID=UPI00273B8359|nr:uncharacterized protein LOC131617767 isoform X4 [Vicia villosa]XP_058745119.1 uncharacterized protein LOC131617851 isoform X4 [Vicia villosa]